MTGPSRAVLAIATVSMLAFTLVPAATHADPKQTVHTARGAAALLFDGRLEPDDRVFGIVVADEPRAYAIADLEHAGPLVHDAAGGGGLDIAFDASGAHVAARPGVNAEQHTTSWKEWIRAHPDTSLWRMPAIAEPEPNRPVSDVRVAESHDYRTGFGCTLMQTRVTSVGAEPPGLFVISGTIENVAAAAVDHVVLRFELVGADGRVVYRDEGFNRSAEALAAPVAVRGDDVVPIAGGATDTFRMIFLSDELPAFERTRVSVARVY
ncbi:MAG TPA: FxLYD domain-containing protein [Candidatus Limnocylindrales bacterium]|nr:FxLYD domain-containing protein [Candidatus Limnocylindrales bacterium]